MRKITEQACRAFHNNKPFKRDNTEVVIERFPSGNVCSVKMILFGNIIAMKSCIDNYISVCFKGYNTVTTRERLNGLSNVAFTTKRGKLYMDGQEIDKYKWYII